MIKFRTPDEISRMARSGKILAECHRQLADFIKPGVTTIEIDRFVERFLQQHNAKPEQKGYHGYPFATCASVNDVICHGFPKDVPLQDGDIVTIDMVVNVDGWLADSAWSYAVGNINETAKRLLEVTKQALYVGIQQAKPGNKVGDISHAIQTFAEGKGYSVVKEFVGHGIGTEMHEDPNVPHFGPPGKGPRLKEGMVITIEPMLNVGEPYLYLDQDGWTARTYDGSLSAQYEHTIAITANGPLILTEQ